MTIILIDRNDNMRTGGGRVRVRRPRPGERETTRTGYYFIILFHLKKFWAQVKTVVRLLHENGSW